MARLISELLGLMRLERGLEKPDFAPIDISELVKHTCAEHALLLQNGMSITTNIEPNLRLLGDQSMLIRLLTNLLSNAARYGKEGGHISATLSSDEGGIRLCVEDDGIGIAPEHLDPIFRRFYQVDPSRSTARKESMGLGLSLVRQIARLHGARISVTSELGRGSQFCIHFSKT